MAGFGVDPQGREVSEDRIEVLAELAYEAYAVEVGGVGFDGSRLPAYGDIKNTRIKRGWEAAVREVAQNL